MQGIADDPALELQTVVAGMHLLPEFGDTWKEIEADGFRIDRKVALFPTDAPVRDDSPVGIAKAMGAGLGQFAEAFESLRPDVIVILGDRYEMLSAASAALVSRIPVAHLHGGEATEGLIDEAIRHSITKMAQLHFVAAETYRRRVIQLGEQLERVFLVGGLGVDGIRHVTLLGREALEQSLGLRLGPKSLLVTFHPVTLETATAGAQMAELLAALDELRDTQLIFTLPNADTDGRVIIGMIEDFVARHANARAFPSLGQQRYLSCLALVDGVVGNSSSGLLEAPSFHKGTVNIGERQRGRLRAASVIDCAPERASIAQALDTLYSPAFQSMLPTVRNPLGEGGASERIVAVLKTVRLDGLLKKRFHDVDPVDGVPG
ncbi:MAG: hypothetical protein RLZZ200_674 [Pseudomonadota bacterium]|jgi:GDP/UDP-N,N'-diacetylbacillosamine 2-epimerase (hydrolysing)